MTVSGRAYPTGNKATSAVYLEKKAPVEVILGTPYEYTLTVSNLTNDKLESVVVTDSTGSGFTMNSSTPDASSGSGGVATWAIGDLGGGESRTITVRGVANGVDMVTTCADVSYASKLCLTTRFVEPALKIEKSGPAEVLLCDPITYTITVSNPGTGAARNVRVVDNLPSGIESQSGQSMVEFTIPELAAGATKTYNVSAKATRTGTFDNNATASADGGLNANSNTVTTTVRQPNLSLTMSCPGTRFGGQIVEYRLAVSNDGDAACQNTVLEATIPAGTTFVDASNGGSGAGGKVQWMLGSVAPGGSADVTFRVRADQLGRKVSNATVTCACSDPATAMCETDVQGIPAILLEVVDVDDPVPVGSDTTYIIT
ncbi:MAG: CARDB domain-containing protein, partial [Planctomycetota bacterium JB042]